MFRFQFPGGRLATGRRKHLLSLSLSCVLAASALAAPPASKQNIRLTAAATAEDGQADPETLLIEVYKALGDNKLRVAQERADKLVEAYPNFRLGHLVRGDLLLMHTRPVKTLGAVDGPDDKLKNLRAEAAARLRALRERPNPNLVPRLVLQLRDDQKSVLLVDARRSRLYVYANERGQLKFVTDYYVSQGKFGIHKLKEGDQKTPVGVYYITSHLPDARLPEFYGSGALPINYPNEWDKLNGRSGSGIWLHGTPPDSFSRPPLASDGCVVLTNPDLHQLAGSVEIGKTPVVISERVDFISKARWESERALAARLVENWRLDVESLNPARVLANYSKQFRSERGEDLKTWFNKPQQSAFRNVKKKSVQLRDITHFYYPGRDDMIVSTFTQESQIGKSTTSIRKRQYWVKEGGNWKIIYELNL